MSADSLAIEEIILFEKPAEFYFGAIYALFLSWFLIHVPIEVFWNTICEGKTKAKKKRTQSWLSGAIGCFNRAIYFSGFMFA